MLSNRSLTLWHYLALIALIYLAYFFGLGAYPLANNNEGLYAEVAREMLLTGDFIIPHLNFVPYIEKPPLLYWLTALSYQLFGVTTFAARLVPAACGALVSIGLLWFGRKIEREKEGWLASVIVTTSIGFIVVSRIVFFDMLLTACFTYTLLLFYLWYRTERRKYLHLAYVTLALAVLTKGMLALVLVPLICFIFLGINHQANRILALFNPAGILIFAAIVLPWHFIASSIYPGFTWDYFVNEQFLRFLNQRQPHDYYSGPFYYYLPRILIYLFPWCLLLPLFVKRNKSDERNGNHLSCLLWLWVFIPLLFFSISSAKANYYMIVSVPALALLLANKLQAQFVNRKLSIFIFVFGSLSLLFASALSYQRLFNVSLDKLPAKLTPLINNWAHGLTLYVTLFLLLSLYFWHKTKRENSSNLLQFQINNQRNSRGTVLVMGTAGLTCLLLILANKVMPIINDELNELTIVRYLQQQKQPYAVYLYRNYGKQSTLLFYLQKRLPIIDLKDADLMYGANTPEAEGWFITTDSFRKTIWRDSYFVAVQKNEVAEFLSSMPKGQFCQVAASGKNVLLTNNDRLCNQTAKASNPVSHNNKTTSLIIPFELDPQ